MLRRVYCTVTGYTLMEANINSEIMLATNEQQNGLNHSLTTSRKLAALMHFPQPIFLLNRDMTLLETNSQGESAIDKYWVGLSQGRVHFNSSEHNKQIAAIVESLYLARNTLDSRDMPSKRFILRNIDMAFRAYTISIESPDSDDLLLFIQGDINCSESKLKCLAHAFSLSNSETKIVKLMVDGLKPKEIAYEAGISLNTVRSHLRTLYAKMQVSDYNEALATTIKLLA